jgi:dTDP-4-amino-4,6-dideoxygalactose transaminase
MSLRSTRHALAVSSATTALLGLGLALDIRGGEFVTTPYTWGGTVAGWLMLGARPVFADIDPDTLTLDPDSVRRALTPETRAILSVDIFGNPADQSSLRQIAEENELLFVSDCAASFGAFRDGVPSGGMAHAAVVSLGSGKALDVGEGGVVLTDESAIYERLVWFTQHPARQATLLGGGLTNEFALNGRVHPEAARWALETFDTGLLSVEKRRQWALQVLAAANRSELTRPVELSSSIRESSFSRISLAWMHQQAADGLLRHLDDEGFQVQLGPSPVTALYRQSAFKAQFVHLLAAPTNCPVAESQEARRFCLNPLPDATISGRRKETR